MTIAIDPADAVQAGLFSLLSGDAQLDGLVTGIFDEVPEDQALDYVVIRDILSTPDNTHGRHGRQITATLHTWTQARSNRPGNTVGARLVALLTRQHADLDAVVDGHTVYMVKHEFHQNMTDPQPGIRHRVDRFRIFTTQEG